MKYLLPNFCLPPLPLPLPSSPSPPPTRAHALVRTHSPTTILSSWCVLPGCLNAHTGRHECLSFPTFVFFDGGTPPTVLHCAFFPQHYMLGQFSNHNQENFLIFFSGRMVLHCLGALQIFPQCLLMDMQGVSNTLLLQWKRLS